MNLAAVDKRVTDPTLLSHLARASIDASGVELYQDYAMPAKGGKGKYREAN